MFAVYGGTQNVRGVANGGRGRGRLSLRTLKIEKGRKMEGEKWKERGKETKEREGKGKKKEEKGEREKESREKERQERKKMKEERE